MNTRIKNDSSRYVSRANLAGTTVLKTSHSPAPAAKIDKAREEYFEKRAREAVIDERWYIKFKN